MKTKKLYKIVHSGKNTANFGFNKNGVGVVRVIGSMDSMRFMIKTVKYAEELFGVGLSLDNVCTNYGEVIFRFPSKNKNKKLLRLLLRLVKSDNEDKNISIKKQILKTLQT